MQGHRSCRLLDFFYTAFSKLGMLYLLPDRILNDTCLTAFVPQVGGLLDVQTYGTVDAAAFTVDAYPDDVLRIATVLS